MSDRLLLIVDDEPNVLRSLSRVFGRAGWHVRTCAEPLQALRELDGVGVVVSDFRMPGMDGIEFLRRVRECRPHTTRYMLTGSIGVRGVTEAVAEGTVAAVFSKPWDEGMLLFAIQRGFELYAERAM